MGMMSVGRLSNIAGCGVSGVAIRGRSDVKNEELEFAAFIA
jgi:hypothetical protein